MAAIFVATGGYHNSRFAHLAKEAAAEARLNPPPKLRLNPPRRKRAEQTNLHRTRARLSSGSENSTDSEHENDDEFALDESGEDGEAVIPTHQLVGTLKRGRPPKALTYYQALLSNPGGSTAAAASITTVLHSKRSTHSSGSGSVAVAGKEMRRSRQRVGGADLGSTRSSTKTLTAAKVAAGLRVARLVTPARSAKTVAADKVSTSPLRPHAQFVALNSQFVALNSQFVALNSQFVALNSQFVALNSQFVAPDSRFVVVCSQFVVINSQFVA